MRAGRISPTNRGSYIGARFARLLARRSDIAMPRPFFASPPVGAGGFAVWAGLILCGCDAATTLTDAASNAPAPSPASYDARPAASPYSRPAGSGSRESPARRSPGRTAPAAGEPVDFAKATAGGRQAFESGLKPDEQRLAATVVVTGLTEAGGADAFVYEQLRKAAGQFYQEQTAGSRARTEANRKRAEREAVRDAHPMQMVWYNYELAEAEIGNSRVKSGPVRDDERVYYLFPLPDLDRLEVEARGLRQLSVDPGSRTVTLRSDLPDPLPDGEPDKLASLYPPEKRLRLTVKYDTRFGEDAARQSWIRQQAGAPEMTPDGDRLLSVAKHRWLSSPNEMVLTVAPVDDPAVYRDLLTFGDVTDFDPAARRIELVAKIPADVLERAEERAELERAARMGRDDREPAPGEARTIWAARVLKSSDDHWARRDAFKHLARTLPEESTGQERAVVGDALLFASRAPERAEIDELTDLLLIWRPEGFGEAVRDRLVSSEMWHREKQETLRKLAAIDDPAARAAAAEAAVALADETWVGETAVEVLFGLGPAAEDAVLGRLDDPKPATRRDVATLLARIGTEKSAERLLSQSRLETDRALSKHLKAARIAILKRLRDADE